MGSVILFRKEESSTVDSSHATESPGAASLHESFGHFLTNAGLIDEQVLDRAGRAAKTTGERLDRVLIKLGLLSETEVTAALAKFLGLSLVAAADLPLQPVLSDTIGSAFIRRNKVLPLGVENDALRVGVVDPFATEPLRAVAYLVDLELAVHVFSPTQFEKTLATLYPDSAPSLDSSDRGSADGNELDVQRLKDLASEAPTIRLVNQIVADAVEGRASDIHIEPTVDALLVR